MILSEDAKQRKRAADLARYHSKMSEGTYQRVAENKERHREATKQHTIQVCTNRQFIGLDGESVYSNRESGTQDYILLGASDGTSISDKAGLSTESIFNYLFQCKEDHPQSTFIYFFGNYDVNFWLKDIPVEKIAKLWQGQLIRHYTKDCMYTISYVPNKWISIGKRHARTRELTSYIKVSDVSGYLQTSFLNAIKTWGVGTPDQVDFIERYKGMREDFDLADLTNIQRYNLLECQLLVQIADRINATAISLGLYLYDWHGAATIARKMFDKHNVKDHHVDYMDNPDLSHAILTAYYGGRVQVQQIGKFDRIYAYDVNSCYPWAMTLLPSLKGRWVKIEGYHPELPYCIYHLRWIMNDKLLKFGKTSNYLMPFPLRHNAMILYPWAGRGWYWTPEVATALTYYHERDIKIESGYAYIPDEPDVRPFAYVHDYYTQRQQYKQDGDARERVIKYGLNSSYGKLAQGVSFGGKRPRYQSYIWAGLITAYSRAKLLEAAIKAPDDVVAFATDGIWLTKPIDLDIGPGLGQWEPSIADNFFILKAGLYTSIGSDKKVKSRTRGYTFMECSKEEWAILSDKWDNEGTALTHTLQSERFIGMGGAASWNRWDLWRTWSRGDSATRMVTALPTRQQAEQPMGKSVRLLPICNGMQDAHTYRTKIAGLADDNLPSETIAIYEQPEHP